MTGSAFFGRAFKVALNVTGLAGKRYVCPGQRKTRFDVVEAHLACCGRRQRVAVRQREQEKTQDCQGSDPERRSVEKISVLHSQVLNPDNLMNRRTTDSRANFLERTGYMASFAIFPETAVVYVIRLVAAAARVAQRHFSWHGFFVAGFAVDAFVPAVEFV